MDYRNFLKHKFFASTDGDSVLQISWRDTEGCSCGKMRVYMYGCDEVGENNKLSKGKLFSLLLLTSQKDLQYIPFNVCVAHQQVRGDDPSNQPKLGV